MGQGAPNLRSRGVRVETNRVEVVDFGVCARTVNLNSRESNADFPVSASIGPIPWFVRCYPPSEQGSAANVQVAGSKPGLVSLMLCLQVKRKRSTKMAKIRVRGKRGRQIKTSNAKKREQRQAERDARDQSER